MNRYRPTDPPPAGVLPSWFLGVVVPAKNEAATLPDCLAALMKAVLQVDAPVHIVVVLDACTDNSAGAVNDFCATLAPELAGRVCVDVLDVAFSNVGAARAAGVRHLLDQFSVTGLWVARTDADSRVPTHWLAAHLSYALAGADAVAGTVTVSDWGDRSSAVITRARAEYQARPARHDPVDGHGHIHAANLGVSARAYLGAAGFPPLPVHEDVALVQALLDAGRHLVWADDIAVSTSARRHARTPGGFAGYLNDLENSTMSPASVDHVKPALPAHQTGAPLRKLSRNASPVVTGG